MIERAISVGLLVSTGFILLACSNNYPVAENFEQLEQHILDVIVNKQDIQELEYFLHPKADKEQWQLGVEFSNQLISLIRHEECYYDRFNFMPTYISLSTDFAITPEQLLVIQYFTDDGILSFTFPLVEENGTAYILNGSPNEDKQITDYLVYYLVQCDEAELGIGEQSQETWEFSANGGSFNSASIGQIADFLGQTTNSIIINATSIEGDYTFNIQGSLSDPYLLKAALRRVGLDLVHEKPLGFENPDWLNK